MKTYDESAVRLRTFTAALAAVCDGRVKVVCDGRACTDGNTIHLPFPRQIISAEYHDALCGIGCHEASHIYYHSPEHFRTFVSGWDPSTSRFAADCYNAVLDVADETRFERKFALACRYFEASTTQAAVDWIGPTPSLPTTAQSVLVAAILKVRNRRIRERFASRVVQAVFAQHIGVRQCVNILRKAVTRTGQGLPPRTSREWCRLEELAGKLFSVFPNNMRQSASQSGVAQSSCQVEADGGGGSFGESFARIIRAASDGRFELKGRTDKHVGLRTGSHSGRGSSAGSHVYQVDTNLKLCFTRYAKLLLQAPKPVVGRASRSGPRIGDVTRVRTDGRALLARAMQRETHTSVAVCLDCSSSMHSRLKDVAGVAAAMVEALHEAGGNVACWHFGDEARRVARCEMRLARDMGGTHTESVVAAARDWLAAQVESRKVLVVFTDGAPFQQDLCANEMAACRRQRVVVLAGILPGCSELFLRASMPGAELFEVGRNLAWSFHQAIRRIVGSRH